MDQSRHKQNSESLCVLGEKKRVRIEKSTLRERGKEKLTTTWFWEQGKEGTPIHLGGMEGGQNR